MPKHIEISILLCMDLLAITLAWSIYFLIRVQSGWIDVRFEPEFWFPMAAMALFWLVVFFVAGFYRPWYAASRLDELTLVFKAVSIGCLFLFFVVFVDDQRSHVQGSNHDIWGIQARIIESCTAVIRNRHFHHRSFMQNSARHLEVAKGCSA